MLPKSALHRGSRRARWRGARPTIAHAHRAANSVSNLIDPRPDLRGLAAAALVVAAATGVQAASVKLGGFVDAGSPMRPALPLVGVSYSSHTEDRAGASLVHRPFQLAGSTPHEGLRPRACGDAAGVGLAQPGDASCAGTSLAGAPASLTRGSGLPTLVAPPSSLPAPMLLPRSTQLSLKVGRASEDAVHLAASTDFVVLADLRYGLTPDHTLIATALRVGAARLVSAASDWRLGELGVVSGGVGVLDRGNGPQSRAALGHELRFHNISTGLRWGRTNRPDPGEPAFAISGAAWRALPEDGDTLAATAAVHLSPTAHVIVTGREHEPWGGTRARSLSLGSSYQLNPENQFGLTVQHTITPEPDQRLLLTWQMTLAR